LVTTQITKAQAVAISEPGHYLRADAADAWERVRAAFGKRALLTDSWRSYEVQEQIFRDRYRQGNHSGEPGFTTDVRTWNGVKWTRRQGTAAAAVPGTSNHGGGVAVDVRTSRRPTDPPYEEAVVFTSFSDPDRLAWLKVAAEHGWADDEGRSVGELWHITYYPNRDQHKTPAQSNPVQQLNTTTQNPTTITKAGGYTVQTLDLTNADKTPVKATGLWVKKLQGLLKAHGHYDGVIDGSGGAITKAGLIGFQKAKNLKPDAICGALTWAALIEQ